LEEVEVVNNVLPDSTWGSIDINIDLCTAEYNFTARKTIGREERKEEERRGEAEKRKKEVGEGEGGGEIFSCRKSIDKMGVVTHACNPSLGA
jgi:hypothetical protein